MMVAEIFFQFFVNVLYVTSYFYFICQCTANIKKKLNLYLYMYIYKSKVFEFEYETELKVFYYFYFIIYLFFLIKNDLIKLEAEQECCLYLPRRRTIGIYSKRRVQIFNQQGQLWDPNHGNEVGCQLCLK